MPTSEQYLRRRLSDTEGALRLQLEAIDREAARLHVPSTELRATDGSFLAAPVLVALAQVQLALLSHVEAGPCGDESMPGHPGTYRCARESGHAGQHTASDNLTRWDSSRG